MHVVFPEHDPATVIASGTGCGETVVLTVGKLLVAEESIWKGPRVTNVSSMSEWEAEP